MARLIPLKNLLSLLLLIVLGGCSAGPAFLAGEDLYRQGRYDEAVKEYALALAKNPDSHEYRLRLQSARDRAAQGHLERGRQLAAQDRLQEAVIALRLALELAPPLQAAQVELTKVEQLLEAQKLIEEAEAFYRARKFPQAKANLQKVLQARPNDSRATELLAKVRRQPVVMMDGFELEITSDKPITLKFKDANIRDVFNILSKLAGVNFIFDEDMRAQNVSVFLEEGTFPQALELLLKMNNLGKKVLNSKNIIIYPRTKEKDKKYDDQVIQTFYLSNIDAKKAVNMLRTMLQLRKIYVHEELNALVIRDTPDTIKLAQQIIESADRADSEVVFDLELIEVNHADTLQFGPKLSSYSIAAGLGKVTTTTTGTGGTTVATTAPSSTNLTQGLSSLESFYSLPTAQFDFLKTKTDSEVLANPRIRVKNREKSKVHIGSREPVVTVTLSGGGGVGGTSQDNVQYVDVGVKLDIEPNIQLDDTIVTKLNLEVSNVSDRRTTPSGSQVLTITTTNAQTGLTLKNGERTVIGGLVRDDVNKSRNTVAFLGELPLLGRLFTSHNNTKTKREILLSITPRVVRSVEMPRADVASIWSGGEDDLKAGPTFGAFAETFLPVTEQAPVAPSPARQAPEGEPVLQQGLQGPPQPSPVFDAAAAPAAAVPVQAAPSVVTPPPTLAPPEPFLPAPSTPVPQTVLPVTPAPPAPAVVAPAVEMPAPPTLPQAPPAEGLAQVQIPGAEIAGVRKGGRVFFQGPSLVKVGEQFSLEVLVDEVENLYSAPLFVGYDAAGLSLVRAEEGTFLRQGGQATIFTTSDDAERNQLIVGYKQGVGGKGASGSGTLFRLVFRAKAPGKAQLDLNKINFRDPGGNRLSIDRAGLTVEVR